MHDEKLGNLVHQFFNTFDCNVKWIDGVLNIENAPKDFEKFFGKKSPYNFSFDPESGKGELITKASYLIKIIDDYMNDKATTTLLKIDFDPDLKQEIKSRYPLMNCKISSLSKKERAKFFIRFTFLTVIQYLNKKEQITTPIYLSNNQVIDIDDSNLNLIDGKKRDINKILNIEKQVENNYEVAKIKIQELLKLNVSKITDLLKEKLNEEIDRINHHSDQQMLEINKKINQSGKRIEELKLEYARKHENETIEKINRLRIKIHNTKENADFERLQKDKELAIQNEIRKHGINIKNKIINTSIVYYPVFNMNVFFKTSKAGKIMEISYDPFRKEMSEINCESCNKKMDEIIVCSSGHLSCRECGEFCESCNEVICKKCKKIICSECSKIICSKCSTKCPECGKIKCSNHFIDTPQGKVCGECLVRCYNCRQKFGKKFMTKNKHDQLVCQKCYAKDIGKNILKEI